MNNIYRSIWNEACGTFVAVSENSKGTGKTKTANSTTGSPATTYICRGSVAHPTYGVLMSVLAMAFLLFGEEASAQMTGGTVVAGVAKIAAANGNTTITQSTPKLILNWDQFNIAAGEKVQFLQPSTSAVALNRVIGSDSTSIFGSLISNGKVFLINPNGILFGKGANVNVAGLVASSADIKDSDFLNGRLHFANAGADSSQAAIVNQGNINGNVDGASIALLGAQVRNDGLISARLGTVALGAGQQFTLDLAGDGLLKMKVDQASVAALVSNQGMIQADGGQVILSARSAATLLQNVVNNTGVIQARTIDKQNGMIRLSGDGPFAIVNVAGSLDVSGLAPQQRGGQIDIIGNTIKLNDAQLNANGAAGGGQVYVGQTFADVALSPNAQFTQLSPNTVISADATQAGDGGTIKVWADQQASVAGTLSAKGGSVSGNGGFIETSAPQVTLSKALSVNTLAAKGKTGVWLLDPVNWVIAGAAGDETPASVTASLASSDRIISATNDISVTSAVTWTTGQKLQLDAGHDVNISAAMTASTNNSAIVLNAGHDVVVSAAMTASAINSKITMTAVNDIIVTAPLTTSASNAKIDLNAQNNLSVVTATADGGGSILFRANKDINISGAITVDTGSVTLFADNDGTGPGAGGGTVNFTGPSTVSALSTIIRFNPANYTNTTSDIAFYLTKVAAGAVDAKAWVFAAGSDKVYDGNTSTTLSFKGTPSSGGVVNLTGSGASFNDKNVGNGKAITFTGYGLSGADAGKFALFAPYGTTAGSGTTTGNITPRGLSVSATGTSRVYNGLTGDTVSLGDNRISGDSLSTSYGSAAFVDPNVGIAKVVNVTGISVSGSDAANYTPNASTTTSANITQAPLSITANDASKNVGSSLTLPTTAFTSAGLVNGETIQSVTMTSTGTSAAATIADSPYAIIPSAATGGSFVPTNYAITYVNGLLTINTNPLVITALDATKSYGQTIVLPSTAFTVTGLVNGETISAVTETSPGTVASAAVSGNPYAITASGAIGSFTPANYTITYVNGALAVVPIPLLIKANDASKMYGQTITLPTTGFTTTGLVNGDTVVSINATSPGTVANALISGNPYTITASGAAGSFVPSNYIISYTDGALNIVPATLVITANSATKNYGQTITLASTAFTSTGLVNGDTITSVDETSLGNVATANVIGSPYAITPSNAMGTFIPANYTLSYVNGALTILPIPLSIKANDATKPYGQSIVLPITAFTSAGLVNGDSITSVTETSPGTLATASVIGSPYVITPSAASGALIPSNYTISYLPGALTITPIPLKITATDVVKPYGAEAVLTAFTQTGLVNAETIGAVTLTSPGTAASATVADSPYVITPSNPTGGSFTPTNYTTTFVNGEMQVTEPVVVTPNVIKVPTTPVSITTLTLPSYPNLIPVDVNIAELPVGLTSLLIPSMPTEEVPVPVVVAPKPIIKYIAPVAPIPALPKSRKAAEPPRKQDRH